MTMNKANVAHTANTLKNTIVKKLTNYVKKYGNPHFTLGDESFTKGAFKPRCIPGTKIYLHHWAQGQNQECIIYNLKGAPDQIVSVNNLLFKIKSLTTKQKIAEQLQTIASTR